MADRKVLSVFALVALGLTVALVVVGVSIDRYVKREQAAQKLPQTAVETPVRVAAVQRRNLLRQAHIHGFLAPFEELSISPDVSGAIVSQHVEVGARVDRDQVLFTIDDAARRLGHEKALAALDRATSEYQLAEAHWSRIRELGATQAASIEHAEAEARHLAAKAGKRQAESVVRLAALMLERTSVKTPIDGVVSFLHARRGEYAQPGRPLVDVIEIDRLRLLAEVEDQDVVWLQLGHPAVLTTSVFPGERFEGEVYRIRPQALPNSRKFEIEILLANADHRLKPGFFMRGTVVQPENDDPGRATSEVLLIPREAVVEQYGASFCFVVAEPAPAGGDDASGLVATRRAVRVLPCHFAPRFFEVVDGIVAGDVVVTKGLQFLSEQTRVIITD